MSALTLEDRFWDKVIRRGDDDCWEWWGGTTNGYGRIFVERIGRHSVHEYAHRLAWMIHHRRRVPKGMEVDHKCVNSLCVNWRHLELVSGKKNKELEGQRQTHCTHGHEYTYLNTYTDPKGHRRCRRCAKERR